MHRSPRTAAAAGGAGLALLAGLLVAPAAAASSLGCELRRLALPAGSPWGTVMDIEQVGGQTVYYGSYEAVSEDGSLHQRSVVWHGLDAQPVDVGPGLEHDTAFDLTRNGRVNGISNDASGRQRSWVRDLASGALHWVPTTGSGPEKPFVLPFRMNESGEMTGLGARGRGKSRAEDALAWDHFSQAPRALPANGRGALAYGLNERGDRVGFVEHEHLKGNGRWAVWRPRIWYADGSYQDAAMAGLDAVLRAVDEERRMAGGTWWGDDPQGHFEAAFWPTVDTIVPLGVLSGGHWSEAFDHDQGMVVGFAGREEASSPVSSPWGTVDHNFLWSGEKDAVRILPSLHAVSTGSTDWREWYSTHAAHAVHAGLDQVGAGTHAGFAEDGTPVGAPTVFLNASQCGVEVATTHTPHEEQDLTEARAQSQGRGQR